MNTSARPSTQTITIILLGILLLSCAADAGSRPSSSTVRGIPGVTSSLSAKIGSGTLIDHLAQRSGTDRSTSSSLSRSASSLMTAVYTAQAPSAALLSRLSAQGARVFCDTWTPPSARHPLGFFLAQIPVAQIADVLALDEVKKLDTAERESRPACNAAARSVKADLAWAQGLSGSGVKIGILDSGLDIGYVGTDLPTGIETADYSDLSNVDTDVSNTAGFGHGTHVTGIALGRGVLSQSNTANGGGPYKGIAPGAQLAFLKINRDYQDKASTIDAQVAAIHAAVDVYHVNVINLSYGDWDAYHDGSDPLSQAIDWAYDQGVSCFVAAGNYGNAARHASGYVTPGGLSEFIEVSMTPTGLVQYLKFNLVWADGADRNDLSLLYYDGDLQPLTNVIHNATTESARGTESQLSELNAAFVNQTRSFYVRVVNNSPVTQTFHLYENNGRGGVQFVHPDVNSTVTTPGVADHAFTVGAFASHDDWDAANGTHNLCATSAGAVAAYSGRGPRIDGMMKPNLLAPGSVIISLRDKNVYTLNTPSNYWVDDDGASGGPADYVVMEGTSMAAPAVAGAAAILYQQNMSATPEQIYGALMLTADLDAFTGWSPNPMSGFGKLNIFAAAQEIALPVELVSFSSSVKGSSVLLAWQTATETNNYGFEIERRSAAAGAQSADAWTTIGFVPGSGTTANKHSYSYLDKLQTSGAIAYRLKQVDRDGRFTYTHEIEVHASAGPNEFALAQNYPNPFNPSTAFRFSVPAAMHVKLTVYDMLGREVSAVVDRMMDAGIHTVEWNASAFPSGVYVYRLTAGSFVETKKLTLQK